MPRPISRRCFVTAGSFALALGGVFRGRAVEPFHRPGPARLRLSLAAYSFRQYFKDGDAAGAKAAPEKQFEMLKFIDYCASHGCDGAELTSYYFPKNVTAEYLLTVKRHAFIRGVEISGTAVGNTFTLPAGEKRDQQMAMVRQWIDHAALLGAPHVRVFAGNAEGQSAGVARQNCLDALTEAAAYAGGKGIFLGIENHGGIVAEPDALLDIVRTVQSPWVGINLDSANFHTDDPYRDFALCAPYAVNVQLKTEIRARDRQKEPANLGRLLGILREARYQGYVALEYEAAEDPHTAVPRALAELRGLLHEH